MMEAECFEQDLNIFVKSAERNHTGDSINKQILFSQQLKTLEDEKEKLNGNRTRLNEIQREIHEKVFTISYNIPLAFFKVLRKAP